MKKEDLLIIEAHSDDSVISIGGFLEKNRGLYNYHFFLMSLSDVNLHHAGFLTKQQRGDEYEKYVKHMNGTWHQDENLPFDADGSLDQLPKKTLIGMMEKVISKVKPSIIICQGPSFHQDHSAVYESMVAATRPTARYMPREIYIMENPTYVHSMGPQTDFKPTLYVGLSKKVMQKKLECFCKCFPSQIRDGKNYLSEEGIRSWARYRGIEARCLYAEAMRTFIRVI